MDRAEQMRKAVLGLEKQLARSPAHFIHMEQWQGYKDGVQDYVKAIRALPAVTPAPTLAEAAKVLINAMLYAEIDQETIRDLNGGYPMLALRRIAEGEA